MSEDDIRSAIAATGDKIRLIKSEKPPTMKEDLDDTQKALLEDKKFLADLG